MEKKNNKKKTKQPKGRSEKKEKKGSNYKSIWVRGEDW